MAARSIANFTITLGLVQFPASVFKATDDPNSGISFNQLHAGCAARITQKKCCSACGKDVPASDIVKGYEISKGHYVTVTQDEIDNLKTARSEAVEILGFIEPGAVDSIYIDGASYYLAPKDAPSAGPFAVIRDAMGDRLALGVVAMYGRDHLVTIRAYDRLLLMQFVRTQTELRKPQDIPNYGNVPETADPRYADLARQLIDGQATTFEPKLIDSYADAVKGLIAAKVAGTEFTAPAAPKAAPALDMMEALKRSLAAAQKKQAA